jgi:hypothetical protein
MTDTTRDTTASRRLTVRRARVYITIGILAAIASGWGSDYSSCQRSSYWVHRFNQEAVVYAQSAHVAREFAAANANDPTKQRLDLQQATADLAEAASLRTQPLACLHFPLPETPTRGLT